VCKAKKYKWSGMSRQIYSGAKHLAIFAVAAMLVSNAMFAEARSFHFRRLAEDVPVTMLETTFGEDWESVRTFRLDGVLRTPLRVYVETNSPLYKSCYQDLVKESFEAWSKALDGRLTYIFVTKRSNADLTIDWKTRFPDQYVAGMTDYGPGFAKVEMRTEGVPIKELKANIMHEIGHGLGIAGHSPYNGDIMQGFRKWHRNDPKYDPTLSAHDVQAIRRLYSDTWQHGEDLYSVNAQHTPLPTADHAGDRKKSAMMQPLPDVDNGQDVQDFRAVDSPATPHRDHHSLFSAMGSALNAKVARLSWGVHHGFHRSWCATPLPPHHEKES
jgi:hypothetical protein